MAELIKTMKLHIHVDASADILFQDMTIRYCDACNYISQYIFDHEFVLNFMELQKELYYSVREAYGLKSQLTISALKTVTARYKTVKEQLSQKPYKYEDKDGKYKYIPRTLEWLQKSVFFRRPQADLVRNRDYSFVDNGTALSINTLGKRVKATFDLPDNFKDYFDGTWSFGTAKLVSLNNEWYFHIPMTKEIPDTFDKTMPKHVIGIDRGLRFLLTTYDEKCNTKFVSGKEILAKREQFLKVRAELQAKGTKSAKRRLKAISGRENRWISDVNHQLSKALVDEYGSGSIFVLEDLTDVSFSEDNLSNRNNKQRNELRSWTFYQFEQFLEYKAIEVGSRVLKVDAHYTSQRCPRCGRIHKENRDHDNHEYICDSCGYRSNDDRVGAMNIYTLGTLYVSGDSNPRFGVRKVN